MAVNKRIRKVDAMAMTTGAPIYTDDLAPRECLIVKVIRSPHAFAKIKRIHREKAMQVPGIACVLTYEDVPKIRHTLGGYVYAMGSPFDRYILEDTVRYVGDAVAIVAGETEACVDRAIRLVKVDYDVLEPVLDMDAALDHPSVIHPEGDYQADAFIGGQRFRNLMAHYESANGDVEAAFERCDLVLEESFHTRANSHTMMETFRTYTYYDQNGKLTVVSSTQIPFLCRRTVAQALGMPVHMVRVVKPKVGGGFGAKQSLVSELLCAIVTVKTRRPAKIVYTRRESFRSSNSRHEMKMTVRMGAMRDGTVRAVAVNTLSNAGAYGEHACGTAMLTGHKNIPLYGKAEAYQFIYDVVYTNTMAGGAFRGFGATQGCFAVEATANKLAHMLGIDPVELRLKNIPREGDVMPAYFGETLNSSGLDRCIERGREMIGWQEKFPRVEIDEDTVRGVGMAISLQSSGIAFFEPCSATVSLREDGTYTVMNGAGDMGTGCDTILAQMAAEALMCDMEDIAVAGVDTDFSPYDKGSYASSTTYVTGMAMVKACQDLIGQMTKEAARAMEVSQEAVEFDGKSFTAGEKALSLKELAARQLLVVDCPWFTATGSHGSPVSPPPLMAGFAEVEVTKSTGKVRVVDYVAVVDCGTVVNPNLATVQTQGGIAQGIGMALFEDIQYDKRGRMMNDSFLQYKIPSRLDVPSIRVAFESSYEPTGPFGAKSIGEVVINTPCPAIQDAIYNAVGIWLDDLPMTPEKVKKKLMERQGE